MSSDNNIKLSDTEWVVVRSTYSKPKAKDGECVSVLKDPQWMSFIGDLFGASSHTCSLFGGTTAEYGPILGIVGAPLNLYHASKDSVENFQLVGAAYRTSRVADLFFWAGKGIGSASAAFQCVIKPLAGGMTLIGIAHLPTLGFTFNFIFPCFLSIG